MTRSERFKPSHPAPPPTPHRTVPLPSPAFHFPASHLPAAFSLAGRSILMTNPHKTIQSTKKKKLQQFVRFLSFSHSSLQNELIFNCNCTKDSTSSKVSLATGPSQLTSTAPSPRSQSPAPSTSVSPSRS